MKLGSRHPGELVRIDCLEAHGLTVADGAHHLGVTRQALNNLVNGKAGISPDMAIRLDKVFGRGAEFWLQHQLRFELARARARSDSLSVRPLAAERSRLAGSLTDVRGSAS